MKKKASVETFSQLFNGSLTVTRSLLGPALLGGLVFAALYIGVSIVPQIMNAILAGAAGESAGAVAAGGLIFVIGFVVQILIQFVGTLYYMVVVVDRERSFPVAFARAWRLLPQYLLVCLWMFLQSYAWISMIGLLFAAIGGGVGSGELIAIGFLIMLGGFVVSIIRGPRLIFASLIYVAEQKGPKAAVDASWARTKGYWWKIVGNMILLGLITIGVMAAPVLLTVAVVVLFLALELEIAAVILGAILGILAVSVYIFVAWTVPVLMNEFYLRLLKTMTQHPRK